MLYCLIVAKKAKEVRHTMTDRPEVPFGKITEEGLAKMRATLGESSPYSSCDTVFSLQLDEGEFKARRFSHGTFAL